MKKSVVQFRYKYSDKWNTLDTETEGVFHRNINVPIQSYEFRVAEIEVYAFCLGQVLERKDPRSADHYIRRIEGVLIDTQDCDGIQYTSYLVRIEDPEDGEVNYRVQSEGYLMEYYVSN